MPISTPALVHATRRRATHLNHLFFRGDAIPAALSPRGKVAYATSRIATGRAILKLLDQRYPSPEFDGLATILTAALKNAERRLGNFIRVMRLDQ